jgi:hypothetical protein
MLFIVWFCSLCVFHPGISIQSRGHFWDVNVESNRCGLRKWSASLSNCHSCEHSRFDPDRFNLFEWNMEYASPFFLVNEHRGAGACIFLFSVWVGAFRNSPSSCLDVICTSFVLAWSRLDPKWRFAMLTMDWVDRIRRFSWKAVRKCISTLINNTWEHSYHYEKGSEWTWTLKDCVIEV